MNFTRLRARHKVPALFHVASSGGTTITRLLLRHFEIVVANEVHPFNVYNGFNPSNPLSLTHEQLAFTEKPLRQAFDFQMREVLRATEGIGSQLLLRVHSHSDYFMGDSFPHSRTVLDKWLGPAVITVRSPFPNWVSARERDFVSLGLGEWIELYSQFLDDYSGVPIYRYEEIMENHESMIAEIGSELGLEPRRPAQDTSLLPRLSGDNRRPTPILGSEFVQMNNNRLDMVLGNPDWVNEALTNLPELNDLEKRLGYPATCATALGGGGVSTR